MYERDQKASTEIFVNRRVASFKGKGVLCTMVIDAEEDFDWINTTDNSTHSVNNMRSLGPLQEVVGSYGLAPTYLLTYPVLDAPDIVATLRTQFERGDCHVGVQLHPWVTPPFGEQTISTSVKVANSFPTNLPAPLERAKFVELCRKFEDCFGLKPTMYRAGRYGIGPCSARLLEESGFEIDTSVAPRTSFLAQAGPDFRTYPYHPFWFGRDARVLEVPLCREIVGWARGASTTLYDFASSPALSRLKPLSILARIRCAERLTLSPEGHSLNDMGRLIDALYATGQRLFVVSLHSSSLAPGRNPYVRTNGQLRWLYDALSGILDFMVTRYNATFVGLPRVPALLQQGTQMPGN